MDQSAFFAGGGGWLARVLVNAGLAGQKNRSRVTWFLVSIFLGPLATGLIVAWRPAPLVDGGGLHPISSRLDRSLVFALGFLVAALALGILALCSGNWHFGGGSITGIALFIWVLLIYRGSTAGTD